MKLIVSVLLATVLLAMPIAAQTAEPHAHALLPRHDPSASAQGVETEMAAQLEAVRRSTDRYRDFEMARADGYVRFGRMEGPLVGEHWYREDLVDAPLDLTRPSTLQYAVVNGERVLVGVAYTVYKRPGDPLPEGFAGGGDSWHIHDVVAIARASVETRPLLRWLVERGIERGRVGRDTGRTQLVMLHAWPWPDNPDGAFANQHRALPYLRAGLPAEFAADPTATETAAWGIALLTDGTCDTEVRRLGFVQLTRSQRRRLSDACESAASQVRSGRSSSVADLNASAAAAWARYVGVRDGILTPEQHARLATVIEHPGMSSHGSH